MCLLEHINRFSAKLLKVEILILPNERRKAFSVAKWQTAHTAANIYMSPIGNCLQRTPRGKHFECTF